MAERLINEELSDMLNNPPTPFNAGPVDDDIFRWKATIIGPADSPYAGGAFIVSIVYPSDYPLKPPHVTFDTKIYHPNVSISGAISVEILTRQLWTPVIDISIVILSLLRYLLNDCLLITIIALMLPHPNPDDALDPNIGRIYKTDRAKFESTARNWTRLYAMG